MGELFRSDLEDRKVERLRRDQDFMEVPFYDPEAHLTGRAILEQSERNRERCVLVGWSLTTGVSDGYVGSSTNSPSLEV